MNTVLWGVLVGVVPVAVGFLLPAISRRIGEGGGDRKIREALDDLWGSIDHNQLEHLDPKTLDIAKKNHERLWHR